MNLDLNILTVDFFTKTLKEVWLDEMYSDLECIPKITRYRNSDNDLYMSFEFLTATNIPNLSVAELRKNLVFNNMLHKYANGIENITGLTFLDLTDISINRLNDLYGARVIFTYYLTKDRLETIKLLYKLKGYNTDLDIGYVSSMFNSCTDLKNVDFSSLKIT